jgi:hypothetical protein
MVVGTCFYLMLLIKRSGRIADDGRLTCSSTVLTQDLTGRYSPRYADGAETTRVVATPTVRGQAKCR